MPKTIPAKKLLLKLPDRSGPALYEVDLAEHTVEPAPEGTEFPSEAVLGAAPGAEGRFSLDLSKLANTMSHWVKNNRSQLASLRVDREKLSIRHDSTWQSMVNERLAALNAQIGPDDVVYPVVFEEEDGSRDMQVWAVRMSSITDSAGRLTCLDPIRVDKVTYGPAVNVIRDELNAGTLLAYLPQVAIPVGVTCYLINLLALEGLDPATLKPI
jgi:hypothetical protein